MKREKMILGMAIIASIVMGCKFNITDASHKNDGVPITTTQWANLIDERPDIAQQFDDVGIKHNETLNALYNELALYKNSSARRAHAEGLSDDEINMVMHKFFSTKETTRSATELLDIRSTEQESYVFSVETQKYIDRVDDLVAHKKGELEVILGDIEYVEKEAELNIPEIDREAFYSYTATTRASLAYWAEHIAEWDVLRGDIADDTAYERGALLNWLKAQRRKIAMCVASDAAGAAVGAGIGASMGSIENGPGAVAGAMIGAIVVGGASSAQGWKTGEFSIVVPWSDLEKRLGI
ncbi:MAG: hypothetical protein IJ191_00285 [Treponema sp.]|nr:hypothetical protein [Treponema sp.]